MSFSAKELKEGQEAYQRVKHYQIYTKNNQWLRTFFTFFFFGPRILFAYRASHFHEAATDLAAAIFCLICVILFNRWVRNRYAEGTAFLTKLRSDHGVEACDVLRKEPSSWRYFLFQRRFPEFRKDSANFSDPLST